MANKKWDFPDDDKEKLKLLFVLIDTKPWIELADADDKEDAVIDYILTNEALKEQFLFIYDFIKELIEEHGYSDDSIHRWWNFIYAEEEKKQLTLLTAIRNTFVGAADKVGNVVHSAVDTVNDLIQDHLEPSTYNQLTQFGNTFSTVTGKVVAPIQKGIARTTHLTDNFSVGLHYAIAALGITIAAITIAVPGGQIAASPFLSALSSYTVALTSSATGNLWDVVGGCCLSIDEFKQGKKTAYVQAFSTIQQAGFTLAGVIAFLTENIGATLSAGFLGFSAAAAMTISLGIEIFRINKCNQKIDSLSKSIDKLLQAKVDGEPKRTPDELDEREMLRYKALNKALLHQRALKAQHVRQAKALSACAVALTAVSIVAVVSASGATFGALPAAIIAVSLVTVLTVSIKKWWTSRKDHVKNLQQALQTNESDSLGDDKALELPEGEKDAIELKQLGGLPHQEQQSLVDKVDALSSTLTFDDGTLNIDDIVEVDLGFTRFGHHDMSIRNYLYDMMYKDPKKAKSLADYLASDGEKSLKQFRKLLSKHQRVAGHLQGRTSGARLFDTLVNNGQEPDVAANEADYYNSGDNKPNGPSIMESSV